MSDDLTPDDPFSDELGARLRAAADPISGDGVTRSGVAAAVGRRRHRQHRTRAAIVGVAAVVAVLGGVAVASQTGGGGGKEQVSAGGATTTAPCVFTSLDDPAGWFRLSDSQLAHVLAYDVLTPVEAAKARDHAVLLTHRELEEFPAGDQDLGRQLFQLGYEDSAGIAYLHTEGLLTADQGADVAAGIAPVLDQAQADRLFQHFPDLVAVAAGGRPFRAPDPDPDVARASGYGIVAAPTETTTTVPGAQTPFEEWVDVLRAQGLLTPEQEAEAAAGRGLSLTAEQGAALQEHWDQQAAAATTTAFAFAPGSASSTTRPDPCAPELPTGDPGPYAVPPTTPAAEATTSIATTTTAAGDVERWALYLYVLDGRRNDDGSITTGLDRMMEDRKSGATDGEYQAAAARSAAADLGLGATWEGEVFCDVGAAEALGLDPELHALAISVTFPDQASAQAAFDRVTAGPLPDVAPPVPLTQACTGRGGG